MSNNFRYWSSLACREDPDIGRRGSLSGKKINHGLAGTGTSQRKSQQSAISKSRTTFTSRPTTTTSALSNENPRSSFPEESVAGSVDDYYFFSEDEEEEEQSEPFTKDPSSFLLFPGIQESRKGDAKANNFGLVDRSKSEEEFGRKTGPTSKTVPSSKTAPSSKTVPSSAVQRQNRFEPQGFSSPVISFNEKGESNLFELLSQLDL